MNSPIIADSSALFSLVVKTDQNYAKAIKISKELLHRKANVIIPGEVFAEIVNALGRKINHKIAIKIGQKFLNTTSFIINDTTEQIRLTAFKKFKSQSESVSFTDCLVMAFADAFHTQDIFGFDQVFRKNGYKRLGVDKSS